MRYVLDSNIAIAGLNGVDAVRSRLVNLSRSEVGIPIVAIAELHWYEAHGVGKKEMKRKRYLD